MKNFIKDLLEALSQFLKDVKVKRDSEWKNKGIEGAHDQGIGV